MHLHKATPSYFKYWGKAQQHLSSNGAGYHLLPFHCLDVAAVGCELLAPHKSLTKDLANFLDITPLQLQNMFAFTLSLHDLGKFASAFQKLYQNKASGLISANARKEYNGHDFRHDRMGLFFWGKIKMDVLPKLLKIDHLSKREQGPILDALMVLMECTLGHHGKPVKSDEITLIKDFTEPHNVESTLIFTVDLFELFHPEFPIDKFKSKKWRRRLEQVSWQLAGIAVLADWIGSDNVHFQYRSEPMPLVEYWQCAQNVAEVALAATDLNKAPTVRPFLSIKDYYGFEPTPLQQWAETVEMDNTPQLFILEDITGAGKTEAALALTHRLMEAGAADGFYFGLPTMATSNAMFSRVANHYQKMLSGEDGKQPSIVLAHGAREMNDLFREAVLSSSLTDTAYDSTDTTGTAQCNQWLADSRKKALLAPVGVGTIDQALMAVLPRRHQSLRLLGLNRKVLIFDEVHAADEFMFELLESLLAMHLHQGGCAILLTATLSQNHRNRLATIWLSAGGLPAQVLQETEFPLATKVSLNPIKPLIEQPLASRVDVSRDVKVSFLHDIESCVDKVLTAAAQGQCVVWVRNSVDDALKAYRSLQRQMNNPDNCLLFHSRFVLQDRKNIENRVLDIFGKSSNTELRAGKVLIATQVFQESLDADADVMICDICPIDDLIQRAGRLHRHTRDPNGVYKYGISDTRSAPQLWVHAPQWSDQPTPDWLSANFRNTQFVYRSPGRLWLGMRELLKLGAIRMPGEARRLIEAVYGDDAYRQVPAALKYQENELIGEERCKAAAAKSQLMEWGKYGYSDRSAKAWYDDTADISTRYSDIETVEVLLLKRIHDGQIIPWVDASQFSVQLSTVKLSKNKYADKLTPLPAQLEIALKQQYPQVKYLQCWLPEQDPKFAYHTTTGFCDKSPQVRGT